MLKMFSKLIFKLKISYYEKKYENKENKNTENKLSIYNNDLLKKLNTWLEKLLDDENKSNLLNSTMLILTISNVLFIPLTKLIIDMYSKVMNNQQLLKFLDISSWCMIVYVVIVSVIMLYLLCKHITTFNKIIMLKQYITEHYTEKIIINIGYNSINGFLNELNNDSIEITTSNGEKRIIDKKNIISKEINSDHTEYKKGNKIIIKYLNDKEKYEC